MLRKLLNKIFYKPSQEEVDRERRLIEEERELIRRVAKVLGLPNRKDIDFTLFATEATPLSKEERAYGEKLADEIGL